MVHRPGNNGYQKTQKTLRVRLEKNETFEVQ